MTDTFAHWVLNRGGFFSRAEAKDCGYSDTQIQAATRSGHWIRLRHGYYGIGDHIRSLGDEGRHRVVCRAVLHRLGDEYVLVGISACVVHGIEVWDADLSVVHVARLGRRSGRTEAGVQFHNIAIEPDRDVVTVHGVSAVRADRAIWQGGCALSMEGALVIINSAAHKRIVSLEELQRAGAELVEYPRTRHTRLALTMADERIETVGESRTFFLCWEFRLPRPEPQFKVYNDSGVLIARTDFAWLEHRYLAEFDGKVKYVRNLQPGESPSDVVFREKCREDLVRDEDFGMGRVIWADLWTPNRADTAQHLKSGMERAYRRYAGGRVIIA